MPFDSFTDYLVAAAYLTPLWIGAFAIGWYAGQRHEERETAKTLSSMRHQQDRIIDAIRDQYGIEGPIVIHSIPRETQH